MQKLANIVEGAWLIKNIKQGCIPLFFFFLHSLSANENMRIADSIYNMGGLIHFKNSIAYYQKALLDFSDDYQSNWKCARACRDYADQSKKEQLKNWKEICIKFGKIGMQYAEKATVILPNRPEGYFYYALNAGIYSDGASILTALKEGLKDKTQNSLEKAYAIDKTYLDGGPPFVLGRFWAVLPWPFKDKKKSLQYYREYQTITDYALYKEERCVYMAELLIDLGKPHYPEAKKLLKQALKTQDYYIKNLARNLLMVIDQKNK